MYHNQKRVTAFFSRVKSRWRVYVSGQRMYLRLIIQKNENRKRKTKKYFYSIHKDKYINQDGCFYRIKNDIRVKNTKRKNHKKNKKKVD